MRASRSGSLLPQTVSVRDDWFAWLPNEKDGLFQSAISELECAYGMLSVTLDDAFALRSRAALGPARQEAGFCSELFGRLSRRMTAILRVLYDHSRHFGTLPNVAPLDPANFRGPEAQRSARLNVMLSLVLFSHRSRFFHKVHALIETVDELAELFREASSELAEGSSVNPRFHWEALDSLHYDLNTCLRETFVVLKSFLCVLPEEEIKPFGQRLKALAPVSRESRPRRPVVVRHRRPVTI